MKNEITNKIIKYWTKMYYLYEYLQNIVYEKKSYHQRLNFYSQFIKRGDLCYDVGANIGNRTDIFLKLGAKVVCIEPQISCFEILKQKYQNNNNVILINKGLGEKEEELEMYICDESPTISTLSHKWINEGRFSKGHEWNNTQIVTITTLDKLITSIGSPNFCKIDAEGYEYNIIKGLNHSIPYISFEFTVEFLSDAKKCVEQLLSIKHAIFNCSIGESSCLIFSKWVEAKDLFDHLESIKDELLWGDIYINYK